MGGRVDVYWYSTMPSRVSTILAASGLLTLVFLGPLTASTYAQETVRGISLFPGPETIGLVPRVETLEHPEAAYTVGAVGATLVVFPFREAWCAFGEFTGFIVGSVARTMVWMATFGDQFGTGPTLEWTGNTLIERHCSYPLYVTADELKRSVSQQESATTAR